MRKEFYHEYYEIESTHWWFAGRRRIFATMLDRYAGRDDRRRMLDLGCGTGTMLQFLQGWGQPIGADVDDSAVTFCRQRGCGAVVRCAAEALPFADATLQMITAFDLLEHVTDEGRVLKELHRICQRGGKLMATVPAYDFLWGRQDEISRHQRRYTAPALKTRVESAGFVPLKISYLNTFLFPIIALVRLSRRFLSMFRPTSQEACVSDFSMTSAGRLNDFLGWLFALEASLLARINLPFGVSILVMAGRN
ncbi:MAG: class I SAM-dependent methyltransferase [Chloroflexi bacterium]|nr:class I SAM-dependent methyltransferase [Chloroflexota bacterium]